MQARKEDQSLGELFAEFTRDTSTLVRQEVALARTELTQTATKVGKDVAFLVVGGVVAYTGVLALAATIILVLIALGLQPWLSALIVGVVVAAIGYALVQRGLTALKHTSMMPQQTIETVKQDVSALKGHAR